MPPAEGQHLCSVESCKATRKVVQEKDVRVRKVQLPARSMRYLLSVDRSLRRVSLRKISVRAKNVHNRVRPRSAKKDAARETTRSSSASVTNGWSSLRAGALALVIVAAATLIAVPTLRSYSSTGSVQQAASAPQATPPPAPPLDTTKATTERVPAAAARISTPDTSAVSNRLVESPRTTAVTWQHAPAIAHAEPRLPSDPAPIPELKPPAEPPTSADAMNDEAVTISGCLQARDGSFWLKDASGTNAPKSRSWKSGFLKKHAEPVQIVDTTKALQFSNYVAQRVTATGTLANRTMQAHSLERVSGSCN